MTHVGRLALIGGVLGLASSAAAQPGLLERFSCEPSVAVLQRAAARLAEVHPERVRSLLGRVRVAGVLPSVKVRAARGVPLYALYVSNPNEGWRLEIDASWSFDRLIFDRNELGLVREAQRMAARREALLTEVAQLYFERRRLQVAALLEPGGESAEAIERTLAIEELTATLDGLTDGALTKGIR
jgi:hypothetical protein